MKMIKTIAFLASLTSGFFAATVCASNYKYDGEEIKITLKPMEFQLPQFTDPLRKREAAVPSKEYEFAEMLRELLSSDKVAEALVLLEEKYNIELSPALLMLKAQIYFRQSQPEKAKETYLYVLKRMPQLVRAHSDLAKIYLAEEQSEKAREHFANAVKYGAKDAYSYGQLGHLNLRLHNAWSAISAYQFALALQPDNAHWQHGLLLALSKSGQTGSAMSLISELIKKEPKNQQLWLRRAGLALQENDKVTALKSVEVAMRLGDVDNANKQIAAQLNFQLENYDRGIELFSQSMVGSEKDMELVNHALSWLTQKQMWDQASNLLGTVVKTMPNLSANNKSQLHLHRGNIAKANKKLKQADSEFKKAISENPNNGKAIIALAELNLKNENYTKAELLFTRAETMDDVRKQAILGKAQVYLDSADYKSALYQLRLAYRKYPERDDLKASIKALENVVVTDLQTQL